MTDTVIVTTVVDDATVAQRLAHDAVESRLAACAQVGSTPITSTYWWRGEIETATEYTVTFKTAADLSDDLVTHLAREHPYDVPEILITPVLGGHQPYIDWVDEQTDVIVP
jgi:periplasmic divalent cation tolerance protein